MQIIKKGYSVNPWRLVDSKDLEIMDPLPQYIVDGDGGKSRYYGNISGRTKKECTEKALNLLELYIGRAEKLDRIEYNKKQLTKRITPC